jgi:translation elongation factor EF-G
MKADPVLLEPIMEVEVTVPDDAVGAVNGDLNSRRGRLLGMEPVGGMTSIRAEVPMAEMLGYAPDLRAMTGGRGDYAMELDHYAEVPAHLRGKGAAAASSATSSSTSSRLPSRASSSRTKSRAASSPASSSARPNRGCARRSRTASRPGTRWSTSKRN